MAEVCKDIDQGLAALNRKIDELNKRLRDLEREQKRCCDDKDKNKNDNKNNNDLEKRIKELEKTTELLKKGIIETLNNFADIENTNREFTEAFQGMHDIITPLIDTVSVIAEFLGGD
ncbi:hypothetical protein NIES4072_63930 [Nostoc commune NIES-4072]|uniref:Uncharacterized protein n=1 Tax=Nostoc commune NIES-4072 TaxID=2005467 RepID=A0A2R5G3Q3_NOSCO|nr:hypothetical protein [Nostoc commune]BBD66338.1 hypothetical protein NIES4070_27030 [Nostoc commune HK-02]GBG22681.1 hypothetical protein NIES4072_63930 [Nostoc commune NIES-4072]